LQPIYIDQSANELRLNIVEGYLNKEPLNVIIEKKMVIDTLEVEAGIIGASHFVTVQCKNSTISEVLACLELKNCGEESFISKISHNSTQKLFKKENYEYEFSSEILDWSDESSIRYSNFEKLVKQSELKNDCIALSYLFPTKIKHEYEAKTEVVVSYNKKILEIRTLHAYPNENKIVFTKTNIKEI